MYRLHLSRGASLSALLLAFAASSALAQEALPEISVGSAEGQGPGLEKPFSRTLPENIPATVSSATAKEIEEKVNAVTAIETLKYLPSIDLRERFIGDQNPMVGFRTVPQDNPAQSLIYMDGVLLSDLLGNNFQFPPVFQMVTPIEISRVDVIYGPFSALYAGNSYGGVVTFTTRMPEQFEVHAALRGFDQRFDLFKTHGWFPGYSGSAAIGDRINDFSFWFTFDHLTSNSQPTMYNPATPSLSAFGHPVVGGEPYLNPQGVPQIVSGALNQYTVQQETYKVKLAYDFTPVLRLTYTGALWDFSQYGAVDCFLRSAVNGQRICNGPAATFGVVNESGFKFFPWGLNPNHQTEQQLSQGLELKSDTHGLFDIDAVVSSNHMLNNQTQTALKYQVNPTGQNKIFDGTGWIASDLRGVFRPDFDLPFAAHHELSFGGHFDQYTLNQTLDFMPFWPTFVNLAPTNLSLGKTQTKALYIQDAWSFLPGWKLIVGGRQEFWEAFDGVNQGFNATAGGATVYSYQAYAARDVQAFSPKASLSYQATPELLLRASYGNAKRFPTVTELYQQLVSPTGVIVNSPNLLPEQVDSYDLTVEYMFLGKDMVRVSLFHEDRWNEIIQQKDFTFTPPLTTSQNVGKGRFNGVETEFKLRDWGFEGVDVDASVTFVDSRITSNWQNPAAIGKLHPRLPVWKAKLVGTYHLGDAFSFSAAMRYESDPYGLLDNSDVNHRVYGGVSGYLLFDAKANYKLNKNWTASAGIDNIGAYKYYDFHPFPQRTFFLGLQYDFAGPNHGPFAQLVE